MRRRYLLATLRERDVRNSFKVWGSCAMFFALASALLTLMVVCVSWPNDDDIEYVGSGPPA